MTDERNIIPVQELELALAQLEAGDSYRASGDLVRAKRCYRLATKLDPTNEKAWGGLADMLEELQDQPGADSLEEVIEQPPTQEMIQPNNKLNVQPVHSNLKWALLGLGFGSILCMGVVIFVYMFVFDHSMRGLYRAGDITGSQQFTIDQGGRLDLDSATFYIPPGALLEDAPFMLKTISQLPESSLDSALVPLGLPVQLETNSSLLRAYSTMSLKYDSHSLPFGISENSLRVARWDTDHWVFLESYVDVEHQRVMAKILHFSSPIVQLFGRSMLSVSGLAAEVKKADDLFVKGDYGAASQSYDSIVKKYGLEKQKQLTDSDASLYWMAYYNLGLSLRKQEQIDQAGQVFVNLLRDASNADADLIKQDGSGATLALTALQDWYPMGVNIMQTLRNDQVIAQLPPDLFSIDAQPNLFSSLANISFDTLPAEIRDYLLAYEASSGEKNATVTDSRVEVLVLSSFSQTSPVQYKKVASTELQTVLARTLVQNRSVSQGTDALQQMLNQYITPYLTGNAATNAYLINRAVPEDPGLRAPLVFLRIQRQWQGENPYYGEYLLALAPSNLSIGRQLSSDRYQDVGLRYDAGTLTSVNLAYNWIVLSQFVTDDVQNLPAESVSTQQLNSAATSSIQAKNLAAGENHSCALRGSELSCWGLNDLGQLGVGIAEHPISAFPLSVKGLTSEVRAVVSGKDHTCALTNQGQVKCWGANDSGQLGDGTTKNNSQPVDVVGLSSDIAALSAGQNHTCALMRQDGSVWCWGYNSNGQLGDGSNTSRNKPVTITNIKDVLAVSAGGNHTCVLTQTRQVFCWGSNDSGQLGNGNNEDQPQPTQVAGLKDIQAIGEGSHYTCALTQDGKMLCWGANGGGQLGTGDQKDRLLPTPVQGLNANIHKIAVGYTHTCVITVDSQVYCWGANTQKQLGSDTNEQYSPLPILVSGLAGPVEDVVVGSLHTCALLQNGNIQCWGDNQDGQLGGDIDLHPAGVTNVVDFGGIRSGAPLGEISVQPAQGNFIELGTPVTISAYGIQAQDAGNSISEVSFWVSYDHGSWQEILPRPVAPINSETSVTWDTSKKEHNATVSFKVIIKDHGDNVTEKKLDFMLRDTQKPISADVRVSLKLDSFVPPDLSRIEMGDWIYLSAENVADNPNGSGIQQVSFKVAVVDGNNKVLDQSPEMFLSTTAPYRAHWQVPPDMKEQAKLGKKLLFTAIVTDKAGLSNQFLSSQYPLTDTTPPTTSGDLKIVIGARCKDKELCIEYGSSATVSIPDPQDVNGSGVVESSQLELVVKQNGQQLGEPVRFGENYTAVWQASKPLPYDLSGLSFSVNLRDNAGKELTLSSTGNYAVQDTIQPTCEITGMTNPNTDPANVLMWDDMLAHKISISGTADAKGGSDIASIKVFGNKTEVCDLGNTGGKCSIDLTSTTYRDGDSVTFSAQAADMAGNQSDSCLWNPNFSTFKVSKARPQVALITPADGLLSEIPSSQNIEILFSEPVTSQEQWISLKSSSQDQTPANSTTMGWSNNNQTFTISAPSTGWPVGSTLTLSINPGKIFDSLGTHPINCKGEPGCNLEKTFNVPNVLPSVVTKQLLIEKTDRSDIGLVNVEFSDPVFTEQDWASFVPGSCSSWVVKLVSDQQSTASKTIHFLIQSYPWQLFENCKIAINFNKIHDHDTGNVESSQVVELPFLIPTPTPTPTMTVTPTITMTPTPTVTTTPIR